MTLAGMVLTVILVIGLAYWFTRYVVGGRHLGGLGLSPKNGKLQLLAQLPVGKDQRLAVVRAGDRFFLLGMTPQNITLLAELTEEEAAAWVPDPAGDGPAPGPSPFQQLFQNMTKHEKR